MSNQRQKGFIGAVVAFFVALLVIAMIAIPIGFGIYRQTNHHQETFTVNKTERVNGRNNEDSKYMVYTDNGVYQDTDSLINGKFNSADIYNQLVAGKKYDCDVVGFRNGFLSWFPNIVSCKEVPNETTSQSTSR